MNAPRPTRRTALAAAFAAALVLIVPAGCEEKLNEADYDQIKVGMEMSEVEAILHGAGEEDIAGGYGTTSGGLLSGSSSQGGNDKFFVWKDGKKKVILRMRDGKVAWKNKEGF